MSNPLSSRATRQAETFLPHDAPFSSTRTQGNFEKIFDGDVADGRVPVSVYRSNATGLTVALHKVPGPIVNGYVALGNVQISITSLKMIVYKSMFIHYTDNSN
jgi:hypothetical protein